MARTNQGGSILSFAVLGGVMALLLIGGVYVVRHNLAPLERESQVTTSQNGSSSDRASNNDQPARPQDRDQPPETATPGNANNDKTSVENSATPAPAGNDQASSGLPSTGPSSAFFAGLMLSGLIGLAIAYVQSRRTRASL